MLGVDVTRANPCDIIPRGPANYSPVLWHLPLEWIGLRNQIAIAFALGVLFLVVLIHSFRLEKRSDIAIASVASISPPVFYALERSNLDLAVFILVISPLLLPQAQMRWRVLSYLGILAGGALKFYPFALLIMWLRESARHFIIGFAVCTVIVVLFLSSNWAFLTNLALPPEQLIGMFGSRILTKGLQQHFDLSATGAASVYLVCCCLSLGAMVGIAKKICAHQGHPNPLERSSGLILAGSLLIVSCFFTGLSIYYRAIFLVPIVAGLLVRANSATSAYPRALYRCGIATTLMCLYVDMARALGMGLIRPSLIEPASATAQSLFMSLLIGKELLWWIEVSILGGLALSFIFVTGAVAEIREKLGMTAPTPKPS